MTGSSGSGSSGPKDSGGEGAPPSPPSVFSGEPFATFRASPLRFGIGIPVVFLGALVVGMLLAPVHLSLAAGALLLIQTGGFLALYLPVLSARKDRRADPD